MPLPGQPGTRRRDAINGASLPIDGAVSLCRRGAASDDPAEGATSRLALRRSEDTAATCSAGTGAAFTLRSRVPPLTPTEVAQKWRRCLRRSEALLLLLEEGRDHFKEEE